jgi:hypothetical protein
MIEFRPHHFMCTLGFEGKGYSDEFVRNYGEIADRLRAPDGSGDALEIRVVAESDSICMPCPNRVGRGCATETKIAQLDRAHASVLGLVTGEVLTWSDAKRRIAENMTVEKFNAACAPCSWRSMGVCEAALVRLKNEATR